MRHPLIAFATALPLHFQLKAHHTGHNAAQFHDYALNCASNGHHWPPSTAASLSPVHAEAVAPTARFPGQLQTQTQTAHPGAIHALHAQLPCLAAPSLCPPLLRHVQHQCGCFSSSNAGASLNPSNCALRAAGGTSPDSLGHNALCVLHILQAQLGGNVLQADAAVSQTDALQPCPDHIVP